MAKPQAHPLDEWACLLGKVISALQSLEFVLRAYLHERTSKPGQRLPYGKDVYDEPTGSLVPVNPMTDFRSLRQLVVAYNAALKKGESKWRVDEGVVDARDALAHGRVTAPADGATMRLIKFEKPATKDTTHVRVTTKLDIDVSWLEGELGRVQAQTTKVLAAHHSP